MRHSPNLPPNWLDWLTSEVELPFRMVAARAIEPNSDQTKMQGLEKVRFEPLEKSGDFSQSVHFEIEFGSEMYDRFTIQNFERLKDVFLNILHSGRAVMSQTYPVSIEVVCH